MDRKISNGFIRNGHFVYDFSYRDIARYMSWFKRKKFGAKAMENLLLQTVDRVEPDLILFGHSELITPNILKSIKFRHPKLKMALWWADWLENVDTIIERLPFLDVVFTTTGISASSKKLFYKNTILAFMPNICDQSIDIYKAFENDVYQYDIFYAGRYDKQRQEIVFTLKKLSDIYNVGLFGINKTTLLFGSNFLKKIGDSKIAINFNRNNNISLYSSDRIVQLAANGTLVFTPKIPDFKKIFNDGEVVYFDNMSDLDDKINYYLQYHDERIMISKNGYLKAHTFYNEQKVAQFMLETIFALPYSQIYGWEDEVLNRVV